MCDSASDTIAYLRTPFQTDGREGVQLETLRTISGTTYYNGIQMYINSSGTQTVAVSAPAA